MRARLVLLIVLASVCTTALSRPSHATDTGEDPRCADECSLAWRQPGPEAAHCYDICVQSKDGTIGCNASGRRP